MARFIDLQRGTFRYGGPVQVVSTPIFIWDKHCAVVLVSPEWERGHTRSVLVCLPDRWDVYWGAQVRDWGGVEPEGEFFLLTPSVTLLPSCTSSVRALFRRPRDTQCGPPTPWAKRTLLYCSSICRQTGGARRRDCGRNTVDMGSWWGTSGDCLRL